MVASKPDSTQTVDDYFGENQYQAMVGFSPEKKVLHIVMDDFQSDIFNRIVSDPRHQHLADALTGFTYFDEHIGTFPYTQMTAPLIVSGKSIQTTSPSKISLATPCAATLS